jgi:hypothetical protein
MGRHAHVVVGGLALLLLAGCATDEPAGDDGTTGPASSPPPASSPAAGAGNGSIYVSTFATDRKTITRYPIAADGSLGEPVTVLDTEADQITFPGVVDGLGETLVTGTFTSYWTTALQRREAATGTLLDERDVDRWCGGEGLTYNACALLDDTRLARTSDLGGDAPAEGTITVSSLADGSDLEALDPIGGLSQILGTSEPDTLLITVLDEPQGDPPEPRSGEVRRLDVASGQAEPIGTFDAGWYPICPLGTDSLLGFSPDGSTGPVVVGPATIGDVTWEAEETPLGCSADGQFLYLQTIPQPPGEQAEDTESPDAPTTIDRITLADGARETVAALEPGVWAEQLTR